MIGITGGSTCSDLAGEGRCASTDGLVAKVMERNCKASCGGCGETRASRAYVVMGDEGDYKDPPQWVYMILGTQGECDPFFLSHPQFSTLFSGMIETHGMRVVCIT